MRNMRCIPSSQLAITPTRARFKFAARKGRAEGRAPETRSSRSGILAHGILTCFRRGRAAHSAIPTQRRRAVSLPFARTCRDLSTLQTVLGTELPPYSHSLEHTRAEDKEKKGDTIERDAGRGCEYFTRDFTYDFTRRVLNSVCANVYTRIKVKNKREALMRDAGWGGKRTAALSLSLSLSLRHSLDYYCCSSVYANETVRRGRVGSERSTEKNSSRARVHVRTPVSPCSSVYSVSVIRGCLVLRKRERAFYRPFLPQAIRARCAKRRSRVPLRDWNAG